MRITFVSPWYRTGDPPLVELLDRYPILRDLPREVAARGHEVSVLVLAERGETHCDGAVVYRCVPSQGLARVAARLAFRARRNLGPPYYELCRPLVRAVVSTRPDIVHVFGLTIDVPLALLARACARRAIPLVVHYHGGLPAGGRARTLQRHNLARVDRVLFTSLEQARPWVDARVLPGWERASELLETSSPFVRTPREIARARTGMRGDPVVLATGRLHPIKDPHTMLRGFAGIARARPGSRLYLYYLSDELLPEMRAAVEASDLLRTRVEFRGRAPMSEMAAVYSSADILLQASLREWSGLAVLEAMSCGCVPVVTDIPSFRAMTAGGRFGRLFPVGDDAALAAAALALLAGGLASESDAVTRHFHDELSFAALARTLDTLYADVAIGHMRPHRRG